MIPAGKGFRRLAFLPSRPFACRLWPVGPQCEGGGRTLMQLCVRPLFLCLSGCRPCVAGLRWGLPCPVGAVAAATVAIGRSWHWLLWRAVIVNLLWCVCHRAACKKAGRTMAVFHVLSFMPCAGVSGLMSFVREGTAWLRHGDVMFGFLPAGLCSLPNSPPRRGGARSGLGWRHGAGVSFLLSEVAGLAAGLYLEFCREVIG